MGEVWITVIFPVVLGTIVIALINIVKRGVMNTGKISPLQCLILYYAGATLVFGVVYLSFWGLIMPLVLSGLWTAVVFGATANIFVQFFNVKAASIDKGEVSLTAPLQAMTPGLITGLAVLLGEYPSRIGVMGIALMAVGSFILLWEKTPEHWYEYFGPIKRIVFLLKLGRLSKEERNKTIVVTLALGSACMGTIGLLFAGLYTRRGITMQGLTLASMGLVGILFLVYTTWYLIHSDAKPTQRLCVCFQRTLLLPIIVLSILWVIHIFAINPTFNHTFVAYTGTLKRFNILISVILGYLIFKEGDFKKRIWAAIFIVAGVYLISLDGLPTRLSTKIEGLGI